MEYLKVLGSVRAADSVEVKSVDVWSARRMMRLLSRCLLVENVLVICAMLFPIWMTSGDRWHIRSLAEEIVSLVNRVVIFLIQMISENRWNDHLLADEEENSLTNVL